MANLKGRVNGTRRQPSLCIQMMPGTLLRLREAAKMRRVGLSEYVVEACLMRMKDENVPATNLTKVSPERAAVNLTQETAKLEALTEAAGKTIESTGWAAAWPSLKALAAAGDKAAAMELFSELRGGRSPAPRADLLRLPEAEAVAWLTVNYPL